jgi:sulfide dehydrogenase [flavocytochrome c] flavoprotein subunit
VRLAGGGELAYDRLILSPGIDFMTDQVGGLAAALDSGRVLHSWKAGPQTWRCASSSRHADGGVFAISIPKVPYRCPPGPYERACMVASYLKQAKPRQQGAGARRQPRDQSKKACSSGLGPALQRHPRVPANAELKEVAGTWPSSSSRT